MSVKNGKKIPASLEFDPIAPIRVPVRIGERHFVLRQAMAGEVILYRNFLVRTTRVDAVTKSASMNGYADSEPYLLAMCLTEVTGGREKLVSEKLIRSWPNALLRELFKTLEDISDLNDDEDEDATVEELTARRDELNTKIAAKQPPTSTEDTTEQNPTDTSVGTGTPLSSPLSTQPTTDPSVSPQKSEPGSREELVKN